MRYSELLTSRQVAEQFEVSVATVGRWARGKQLPSIRTPAGRLRFRREDVERAFAVDGQPGTAGAA